MGSAGEAFSNQSIGRCCIDRLSRQRKSDRYVLAPMFPIVSDFPTNRHWQRPAHHYAFTLPAPA
jgi:hypothetical protein